MKSIDQSNKINHLPRRILRENDKSTFVLISDGKYYLEPMLTQFPESLHNGYPYEALINDWRKGFSVVNDGKLGPETNIPMTIEEIEHELRRLEAPLHDCCRCGSPATSFQYGAYFCTNECAESASDCTVDDGQQIVKSLWSEDDPIMDIVNDSLTEERMSLYWTALSDILKLDHYKYTSEIAEVVSNATSLQKAEALLKVLGTWRKRK